jgi:hypothetical protein
MTNWTDCEEHPGEHLGIDCPDIYRSPVGDKATECPGCGKETLEPFFLGGGDYCTDCIRKGKTAHAPRPVRGSLTKVSHVPSYDMAYHDLQAAPVGAKCASCGMGSDPHFGAVGSFPDPRDPVESKVYMHPGHFEEFKAAVDEKPAASQQVTTGDGKGITINIYAGRDGDEAS